MLEQIFLQILNLSFNASLVILFVLAARLLLKKAPKIFSYALWSVVLFRLLFPFSMESLFSLLPTKPQPIPTNLASMPTPQIDTGIRVIDRAVNPILPALVEQEASVNPMQIWIGVGSLLWVLGIATLLTYSVVSLFRLRRRLRGAVPEKGNVWLAQGLETPFVLGVIHPRIYLPSDLTGEEKRYILLHERTHIKRLDHVVKLLAFLALCLHWFNPLVWAAFFLSGRDMEMSCDESVVKRLGGDVKKSYSSSLLSLATGRKIVGGTPLAFGEGDTKQRIQNILHYKKPAFWAVLAAVVLVAALCLGLMTNPRSDSLALSSEEIAQKFTAVWLEKWNTIEGHDEMLLGEGKAYLADVTGDGLPELFFLYDNYKLSGVVVYDISGKEIQELGSFDASSFYGQQDVRFALYRGNNGSIVHTESILYGSAADPRDAITDVYAVYQNGRLQVHEPAPYRIASRDGSGQTVYYASPYDATVIPQDEHERRVVDILGQAELAETIVLTADSPVVSFQEAGALEPYIQSLVEGGNSSVPGVQVTSGGAEQSGQSGANAVLPVNPEGVSEHAQRYLEAQFNPTDQTDEQAREIVQRLWYLANAIYNVEDRNFSVDTEPPEGVPAWGETRRFVDLASLASHVFTENGAQQLLTAEIGGGPFLYYASGVYYHLGGWKTNYLYEDTFRDVTIERSTDTSIEATVSYAWNDMDGNLIEVRTIPMRIVQENGRWLVDSYQFPEAQYPDTAGSREEAFIRSVLQSVRYQDGAVELTLPETIPDTYQLSIEVSGLTPTEDNSHAQVLLFQEESETGAWEGGKTYRETLLDGQAPDGTELYFEIDFSEPEQDGSALQICHDALKWIFNDGVPEAPISLWDTQVAIEQNAGAGGNQAVLTYTESDGNVLRLCLTLPSNWSLALPDADAEENRIAFAAVLVYADGEPVGTISYCDFEPYEDVPPENYYRAVYNQLMLGSMVNWDNEYTPVVETENACTATVQIYHREGYGDGYASGLEWYSPGILSYNKELLRYVAIGLAENTTNDQVLEIAKSLTLTR